MEQEQTLLHEINSSWNDIFATIMERFPSYTVKDLMSEPIGIVAMLYDQAYYRKELDKYFILVTRPIIG